LAGLPPQNLDIGFSNPVVISQDTNQRPVGFSVLRLGPKPNSEALLGWFNQVSRGTRLH